MLYIYIATVFAVVVVECRVRRVLIVKQLMTQQRYRPQYVYGVLPKIRPPVFRLSYVLISVVVKCWVNIPCVCVCVCVCVFACRVCTT